MLAASMLVAEQFLLAGYRPVADSMAFDQL
jgi:hypothetical protein